MSRRVTACRVACCVLLQADVYERLDALDSDTTEARAASILHGLGFDKEMQVGEVVVVGDGGGGGVCVCTEGSTGPRSVPRCSASFG